MHGNSEAIRTMGRQDARERILQAYPYLEPEDIDAALAYAAWRLEEREEPLVDA